MRVAFATNNLKTISNHTALSKFIAIVEIKNKEITERIAIKNPIPQTINQPKSKEENHRGLGSGKIIPQILLSYGVDIFLAREIGEGMQRNLDYSGIKVLKTEEKEINKLIKELKEAIE